jgi:nucleotide-binding universal stress UspA family protein
MFTQILVAIDGSKISDRALKIALDEAKVWNATVNVIYVVETGLFSSLPMDNTWEIMYSMLEKEGQDALDEAKKEADARHITLKATMKQGHAGNEIVNASEELAADLVIVVSHGRSEVDRILLGSVSSFVVSHSKVSVMVVRV